MNATIEPDLDHSEIHDRGYRTYVGARSGVVGAIRSLVWQTIRSVLGLGRAARHKVFPVIIVVIAAIPAVVFLGIAVLFRDLGDTSPTNYSDLFSFSIGAVIVFAAAVVPEALVRDRRDQMLSLYLSTPLTRRSYLGAKVIAVVGVMMIITLGPVLLALLGYTVVGDGPDGVFDWLQLLVRLTAASLLISAVMAAVSMGCASLTDRRAVASTAVALLVVGGGILISVLVNEADFSSNYILLDPLSTAVEMATRVLGESSESSDLLVAEIDTSVVALASFAWFAVGACVVGYKYNKLEVI